MSGTDSKYDKMSQWITDLLDDKLSGEDYDQLQKAIHSDPACLQYYVEYMALWSLLRRKGCPEATLITSNHQERIDSILEILAENEETANPIETIQPVKPGELSPPDKPILPVSRFGRHDLVRFILKLAAVLVVAIGIIWLDRTLMNRQRSNYPYNVAQITHEIDIRWDDTGLQLQTGQWMGTGSYHLKKGYIELCFLNGAYVVLEAPAEFTLISRDSMYLEQGKLYATVPRDAIGFTVNTHNSKIIDLGTEFGVIVGANGDTDMHVLKGKTQLVASKVGSIELSGGQAVRVSSSKHNEITNIHLDEYLFIRRIDGTSGMTWNGSTIDLADIVGHGNGFGTGRANKGIDIFTGKPTSTLSSDIVQPGPKEYIPVPQNAFIDGVFVPGASRQSSVQLSTTSLTTDQIPPTTGEFWGYLINGALHRGSNVPTHNLVLDGKALEGGRSSALTMHSNLGVTFDLNHIRNHLPRLAIKQFSARAGLSETAADYSTQARKAEFWVFIDGDKKYHKRISTFDKPLDIEIPIDLNARFLTLAVTEADDGTGFDWAVFANPRLVLEAFDN